MSANTLGLTSAIISVIVVIFWFRAVYRVALPQNRMGYLGVLLISAAFGIYALTQGPGVLGAIAAGVAIVIAAFFALTIAIGNQKVADGAINVGESLPQFTATDEFGETFDSKSLAGNAVLIKFFRGHW